MEISDISSFSCIQNNRQKTRLSGDVFHNEVPPHHSRMTTQSSTQGEIPVIDLTIDTPSQNEQLSAELQQNHSLFHGRAIDVIDVDSLPDRQCSQRHLEYFQPLSFESFIDLGDMLVLGHSLSQRSSGNATDHLVYPRRITRQAANQIYQWEDQIIRTNDSFLHALMNRMTSSSRRRTNASVRRSTSYPYYIRSHQDLISSSLDYDQLFAETDNEVVSRKNTSSASGSQGISDDPVKKSIWIGKCGHVYCGSCAFVFRSMKSKGPHAAICAVEHCHKIITGNHNLREIYRI
ncbi:unnamed protein product [Pneumocystis jirovecii]|uniref:Uncharacterized protein n=1 Tax=Pneumocystis jirovecii TaxID=42068 RepID=L0PF18_PNEJI|nr:unnamed protein product [Pneumocystis jirovecii]